MKLPFLVLCAFVVVACSRPDVDPPKKAQLVPFTVTVVERKPNTAILQWTPGSDDPTAVKYRVFLDGKVVSSDLTRQADTLRNLSANLAYSGSVCVYTPTGDSAFASFTLPKLSSTPRPLRPFTVTVLERAPATAIIEWTESFNPYDSEIVKYDVILQGQTIHSSLIRKKDTLTNLHIDSTYTGSIRAYTIAGDTASAPFQLDRLNGFIFYGMKEYGMQCFNLFTGTPVWQSAGSSDEFHDMPTIVDSTLYVNAHINGSGGIYAFHTRTGQTIWKTQLPSIHASYSNSSLVYKNGVLYTVLLGGIHALNAASGQVLWKYTPYAPASWEVTFNPVVGGNLLFATMKETDVPTGLPPRWKMVALNTSTGLPVWENSVSYMPCKNPVVYGGLLIYGASDGKIYALNQADGTVNWSRNFSVAYNNMGADMVSPVISNNMVIVHNGNSGYYALAAQTGSTLWNYPAGNLASSPAVGNGMVYFSNGDGLVALNLSTGTKVWERANGSGVSPLFINNRVYLNNNIGYTIYNALNGQLMKQITVTNGVSFHGIPAIVSDGGVYYAAESGMLQ